MIKVSIIIPVYNGEQYLEQCIRSVLSQTLKELEILCVDDGSGDGSAQIIRNLRSEDDRVRLLWQRNQGAGKARNLALKEARGKYIAFLDADDFYVDRDALEKMVELCESSGVDVCGSLRKLVRKGTVTCDELFQKTEKSVVLDYRDFQIDYNYQDFIFLRKHLTENNLSFPDYRRFQDPPFLVKALFTAGKFTVADTYLYGYRLSDMSVRFNKKSTYDLLHGLIDNLTFAREHELEILFENTMRRLEYEYKQIFYKNIAPDGLEILKLLLEANQIISNQKTDQDYIIKPLQGLFKNMCQYERRLLARIEAEKEIVLYGAGQFGQVFYQYLKRSHVSEKVVAFVVSDRKGNQTRIEGVPVITLWELQKKEEKLMLVTVRENIQGEIVTYLEKNGYKNYELIEDDFFCRIVEE